MITVAVVNFRKSWSTDCTWRSPFISNFLLFILRRTYTEKRICFECGSDGHLSYMCPGNVLGNREPPPKKIRKKKKTNDEVAFDYWKDDSDSGEDRSKVSASVSEVVIKKPKYKKSAYLSDEEELSE